MGKPTKKRVYYNETVLNSLVSKYGYSIDYIRKCIRGDRKGLMPDAIKREYQSLTTVADKTVENKIKKSLDQ